MAHRTYSDNDQRFLSALAGETQAEGGEMIDRLATVTEQRRITRARETGPWCWYCGGEFELQKCGCGLPIALECGGKRVCSFCASAHKTLATHLRKLFSARVVDRSSSVRARLFNNLFSAADEVFERSGLPDRGAPFENSLKFHIAQACPFDQSPGEFRDIILGAFRASRFTQYRELAEELDKSAGNDLINRMARYFSCAV
jgi:hypothetical protein